MWTDKAGCVHVSKLDCNSSAGIVCIAGCCWPLSGLRVRTPPWGADIQVMNWSEGTGLPLHSQNIRLTLHISHHSLHAHVTTRRDRLQGGLHMLQCHWVHRTLHQQIRVPIEEWRKFKKTIHFFYISLSILLLAFLSSQYRRVEW